MPIIASTTARAPNHHRRAAGPHRPLLVLCVLAATATALTHHGPVTTAEAALSSTVLGCDRTRGTNCTCSECPAHNGFHAYCASTMQCLRSEADCGQCPDAGQCVALSNCSNIPPTPAPAPVPTYNCGGGQCVSFEMCREECDGDCNLCSGPGYTCGGPCYSDYGLCRLACEGGCAPCSGPPAPTTAPAPPAATYNCAMRCVSLEICRAECDGICDPCTAPAPIPPPPAATGFTCGGQCYADYGLCRYECGGNCGPCQLAAAVPVAVAAKKARPSGFSCGGRCFASAALCRFECGGDCGSCKQ